MLKPKEAAAQLNAGVSTIHKWVDAGHFPNAVITRLPGQTKRFIRIPEGDVIAFLNQPKAV